MDLDKVSTTRKILSNITSLNTHHVQMVLITIDCLRDKRAQLLLTESNLERILLEQLGKVKEIAKSNKFK